MKGKYLPMITVVLAMSGLALLHAAEDLNQNALKLANDQTIGDGQMAQSSNSPVGYWLQYSDDGKQAQSILEVYAGKDGRLEGRIVVPFVNMTDDKKQVPDVSCKKCGKGDENGYTFDYSSYPDNQVQGLKMMWSFTQDGKRDGSDGALYGNGSILDPSSGKVYSCKIQTQENGKKLYVRGYIGFSLFGRTQYWYRIDQQEALRCVKACGITTEGHYAYADKTGKIINEKLWQQCSSITITAGSLCDFEA
ncbi:DUF2147 domain-containing protein [Caedibacter taeniospiralis]|uniref:DUF2147 domain-containing protein n=1 Tax=Caedibacter taeniospiralis TaxID=28907 RepID=UPI0013021D1C|nr:DUF2147 domain-containing protein [Caedibacter taeniospiralis]